MKRSATGFAIGALACALSALAVADSSKDWVDIRGAKELTELYAGKTFKGNGWTGHYRADGNGIVVFDSGRREPRTWQVKGEDQVCVTTSSAIQTSVNCFTFQRHRKNPAWVNSRNLSEGWTFTFTVEDGIPKF